MRLAQPWPASGNKLTIVIGLCCSREDEGKAVGDLSPLQLLWAVTHSNGMSLAETPT